MEIRGYNPQGFYCSRIFSKNHPELVLDTAMSEIGVLSTH